MAKFLVMTHPKEPLPDSGYRRLPGRVEYWAGLRERGGGPADEVEEQESFVPEVIFDVVPEDPEVQAVAQEV